MMSPLLSCAANQYLLSWSADNAKIMAAIPKIKIFLLRNSTQNNIIRLFLIRHIKMKIIYKFFYKKALVKNSVVVFLRCVTHYFAVILSVSEVSSDAKHHIVSCETIGFFGYASE